MINHSPASEATDSIDTYPATADRATLSLASLLRSEIEQNGPMPFDLWMQQCLYHPQLGYYNQGDQKVGRAGDFYTSISVGSCFGMILAHRIIQYAKESQHTEPLDIVEIGANAGHLACDILDTLAAEAPQIYAQLNYIICEPLASMRSIQRQNLEKHSSKLTHHSQLSDIQTPLPHAVLLSNELIDAFPVKLITKKEGRWLEKVITYRDSDFAFSTLAVEDPELSQFITTLPENLPDGYCTEFRPGLQKFTRSCSESIEQGLIITIDYGHIHADYYSPERTTGTLRTFHNHTAGENPLENIGTQDITAHVDFTQLANHFLEVGLAPSYFDTQSRYLTHHAHSWFSKIEASGKAPPSKLIRQFQTLTHPTMMGRQFQVLECHKGGEKNSSTLTKLHAGL